MSSEKVAICGMSGRFPKCDNIEEFTKGLVEGADLLTDNHPRFPHEAFQTPSKMGIINNLDQFDAQFFNVNSRLYEFKDPKHRILLEVAYEAIIDAGINPATLRGSNTGVFLGMGDFPSDISKQRSSCLASNGISYIFDFKGPSCVIDTACSSSIYALHQAVQSIEKGICDSALVGSAQLHTTPYLSFEMVSTSVRVLSQDGSARVFDEKRDGYLKAEAVSMVFLQKTSIANRIYATVEGFGVNTDGFKAVTMFNPSGKVQASLIKNTLQKSGIHPNDIEYIECHATGTKVGDAQECYALKESICKQKKTPLPIGSVKASLGHGEFSSGMISLVKVLICMHTGILPKNLNYNSSDIKPIVEGHLKVFLNILSPIFNVFFRCLLKIHPTKTV